jgi:hypothetical protein
VAPPPASPIEPPAAPVIVPSEQVPSDGGAGAGGNGPANLPDAGFGPSRDGAHGLSALVILLGGAGLAMFGAAAAVRTSRDGSDA